MSHPFQLSIEPEHLYIRNWIIARMKTISLVLDPVVSTPHILDFVS